MNCKGVTFKIRIFSFKKLALINGLGTIPILAICISLAFYFKSYFPLIAIIPLEVLLVIQGHKIATKDAIISIDSEFIKVDDLSLPRASFLGYFLNDYGIYMSRLEFLLENGIVHTIDFKTNGSNRKTFEAIFKELNLIKQENKNLGKSSNYEGMHVTQIKSMRFIIYFLMGIVVLIDIIWLFLILSDFGSPLTYKILLANFALFYFIPYLRKK